MKHPTILLSLACVLPLGLHAAVIDLRTPITDSLTPDFIYYNFQTTTGTHDQNLANLATSGTTFDGIFSSGSFAIPFVGSAGGMPGFGNAATFPGGPKENATTRNPHLSIANSGSLNFSDSSFTLGTWIKLDTLLPTEEAQRVIIFDKGGLSYNGAGSGGFTFYLERAAGTINSWELTLQTRKGDGGATASTLAINLGEGGEWHHLGLAFDSETLSATFWLDGMSQSLKETSTIYAIADTTRSAVLGERQTSGYSSVFNGQMDDFFITSGVHTFAIPEPSITLLLLGGAAFYASSRAISRRRALKTSTT